MTAGAQRRSILLTLCVCAAAARVGTNAWWPNIVHPDETIQYLEQSFRLLTGHGFVPWEYVIGARSWLVAATIVPAMKAGLLLSASPPVYLWCVALFMIAWSICGVASAFVLGERAGGLMSALFAGMLASFWCELVYMAPHVLADSMAAMMFVAALATCYRVPSPGTLRMIWAGAFFGCALVFRIQLSPAIAVAMIWIGVRDVRRLLLPMILGALVPLFVLGITDWVTWGWPYRSVYTYVRVNAGGVADAFERYPWFAYLQAEARLWQFATPIILLTAAFGARRLPLLAVSASIIIATFSCVAHKEYRFIYPALPLVFTLCGVGTAEILASWAKARPRRAPAFAIGATLFWLTLSLASAVSPSLQSKWRRDDGWLEVVARLNAQPDACGVGLTAPALWSMLGYVRLRRGMTIFDASPAERASSVGAYNYVIAANPPDLSPYPGPFQRLACYGSAETVCLYRRPGSCADASGRQLQATADADVSSALARLGFPLR